MTFPRSIVLRTSYFHHSENSGYKQILRYTKPQAVFGIDEYRIEDYNKIMLNYRWLVEFNAAKYARKNNIDLIHILYGEEYYRFTHRLVKEMPIVVTYHQPAEQLKLEIEKGNLMGRVYQMAHRLNKKRFQRISAAIVMTEPQKKMLANVMPVERIHVIPLGADIVELQQRSEGIGEFYRIKQILTIGDWLRDWDFFFKFADYCSAKYPDWKFIVINRKFSEEKKRKAEQISNIEFIASVEDNELYTYYKKSALQFLPFTAAAGNNSVNEGLAMGCPVVTNIMTAYSHKADYIGLFEKGSLESAAAMCKRYIQANQEMQEKLARQAKCAVMNYDWSVIGEKTIDIYNDVLSCNAINQ